MFSVLFRLSSFSIMFRTNKTEHLAKIVLSKTALITTTFIYCSNILGDVEYQLYFTDF